MPRFALLLIISLLAGCAGSHLHVGPTDGPAAYLREEFSCDDRNGEYLRETYRPTAIDGKVLRPPWRWVARDDLYAVLPGRHKIVGRVAIKRGSVWEGWREYYGVIEATLTENHHYLATGAPRFADNQLDLWLEDIETGTRVSDPLSLDLSNPVQQPNVVTYPIYIPAVKTGR